MADNHLKLNAIIYMFVHSKHMSALELPVPNVSVGGSDLPPQPAIRNLGIKMNSILSVNDHSGMICKRLLIIFA